MGGFLSALFAFSFGWYEAGKIAPEELGLAVALPLIAWGAASLFFRIIVRLYPVEISSLGLRCYDLRSKYHLVAWNEIESITHEKCGDLPYLFIRAKSLKSPLILPMFIEGMSDFSVRVAQYAGEHHPLVQVLQNEP
jgi:hypothetical protein